MSKDQLTSLPFVFDGGVNEVNERGVLPTNSFSRIRNMRWRYPGFEQRLGTALHHTAATDNANEIISLNGFSKSKITERALFAQYSNGEVRKATDNPPAVTTGEFGTQVMAARTGASPATYDTFVDHMIYADGADMAQIYTGALRPPIAFNVYKLR